MRLALVTLLLLSVIRSVAQSDSAPQPKLTLDSVGRAEPMRVQMTLQNSTGSMLFVPICGRYFGEALLCFWTSALEVQTPGGWRTATRQTNFGLLGRPELDRNSSLSIAPKTKEVFLFESDEFTEFGLVPGQLVRLVVYVWPSRESVGDPKMRAKLVSEAFNVPPGVKHSNRTTSKTGR